jgi:tRNA G18 (ribose-2'-O)-methylase SpoU
MQTRCPFADCLHEFHTEDENEFSLVQCAQCSRPFTSRTLARHHEIDKQVRKHAFEHTLADEFFQSGKSPGKMVAILEEVRSLWNVGSIFRSSDGAGFSHLFLIGITGCPPRKEIAKTSLGAEDHVGWNYSGSSLSVITSLKSSGYQIVALEKTNDCRPLSQALKEGLLKTPLCLVVGNEVKGVYAETLAASDLVVDMPMRGFKESLNVAVAFGIASYAMAEALMS